jgi:hypothetical protein
MTRKKVLLMGSLCLIIGAGSWPSATTTITVGANVNITKRIGSQAEGTIAVNPTNPLEVFAAHNPPNTTFWRSSNGGTTWVAAGAGIAASCCDEVASWDDLGNLFLVNINAALNAITLYLSTDGGANFTLLQTIDTGSVDQPAVRTGAGSVWVTWNNGGIKARGAAVTGLGAVGAFTAIQSAPGTSGQFGDIAIGPAGQVVVVYQESNSPCPCRIFANTDADGLGAGGFGAQVTITSMNVNTFDSITPQAARTVDSEANLAWDRSGGPHNGRLYLSYTNETPDESNNTDIFVRHSDDNGATWSAALRVNDDATTTAQFLPNISVDQTNGFLALSWHDARNDTANNLLTEFWGAASDDGGATFLANFKISAGRSNANTAASSTDYGDFTSSDFHAGTLHVIWADNSNSTGDNPAGANSTFDIYTAAIRIVVNTPPVLAVPGPQTVDFHDSLTFNVSAMDADASDTLSFTATGLPAGLSLTDHGNRTATVSGTVTATPGLFTATITVTDHINPAVSKTVAITVTREETTTHYTGPFVIANGFPATPHGRLLEDGLTPIAGRMLTLTIGPDSCIAGPTDAGGNASCTIPSVSAPLGTQTVKAAFLGDTFYLPSSETATATVFSFLDRGAFVLGNLTAAAATPTTDVTFWGAQWADLNALSGGSGPNAFKGFASNFNATPPACGGTWTASPGNSGKPVAPPLPAFMGVVVASSVTKSGSTISGNIAQIVVVTPNPGYEPNPGHAGTGRIVAVLCP